MNDRHRNRALDGLRALAAVVVVAFHCRVPHVQGGFIGVDVFFVLSGFLITRLLREGTPNFYLRRAKRLVPAFAAMLVAYVVAAPFLWPTRSTVAVLSDVVGAGAYLSDYWIKDGVWPMRHTWSLAIEAQFYLLWPLVVRGLPERRAVIVLTAGWLALTAWRAVSFGLWGWDAAYYHLDSHATGLIVGAMLTYLPPRPARYVWPGLALIVALVLSLVQGGIASAGPGIALSEGAAALLVIGLADSAPSAARKLFGNPLVSGLGVISYGVYLWHYPIALLTRDAWPWWLSFGFTLTLSIALAALSYFTVEAPFRRPRKPRAVATTPPSSPAE